MRYVILLFMLLLSGVAEAQMNNYQQQNGYQPQNAGQLQNNQEPKMKRSLIRSHGDQRKAFNLLILQDVATYKLGDENLSRDIAELKSNQEYYEKLEKIRRKLSNSKIENSKNKEVLRILDDAGNRIYNLLYN